MNVSVLILAVVLILLYMLIMMLIYSYHKRKEHRRIREGLAKLLERKLREDKMRLDKE